MYENGEFHLSDSGYPTGSNPCFGDLVLDAEGRVGVVRDVTGVVCTLDLKGGTSCKVSATDVSVVCRCPCYAIGSRSEEHTSEFQSHSVISYAVF